MKITMYELLGLVKDGKAPKRIRIKSASGVYDKEFYFDGDIYMYKDEYKEYAMTDDISIETLLNDEVEILDNEEKGLPGKLGECAYVDGEIAYSWSKSEAVLKTKINELIDYLEKQRKGE